MLHVVALQQPRWWRLTKAVASTIAEGLGVLVWVTGLIVWMMVCIILVLGSFISPRG